MLQEIFPTSLPLIGYVQLEELTRLKYEYAFAKGIADAIHLERGGIDAIVIENYSEPEEGALASMESKQYLDLFCSRVKGIVKRAKLGINVLQADLMAALELAQKYNFYFVHADIYADVVRSKETSRIIQVDLPLVSKYKAEIKIPLLATIQPAHAYELCGLVL